MSSYYSILSRQEALPLLLAALFLVIAQAAAFLLSLREKRKQQQTFAASAHLLLGFLFFVIMLNSYDIVCFPQTEGASIDGESFPYSLPWLAFTAWECLSALILMLQFREYRRFRVNNVMPDAIRRTIDLLPEGICISAANGSVHLSNLKMDTLCRELTGERLADPRKLWAYLEKNGEDQEDKRLIHTPHGEAWLFSKGTLNADGRGYDRTSAVNVTERYRITEELREKNAHLLDIRSRMKEAADLSSEMFVKQEEAAARSALHNELGQVLLMGRYYIEHPDATDAAIVSLMMRQMNRFLLGESQAPGQDGGDELEQAVSMAGSIGVTVVMRGEPPKQTREHSLLAAAIRECAANAVKHAGGDRLFVEITRDAAETRATITNNGKAPTRPVAESGGLLSLRRSVEAAGGQMIVRSAPAFSLTLVFMDQ